MTWAVVVLRGGHLPAAGREWEGQVLCYAGRRAGGPGGDQRDPPARATPKSSGATWSARGVLLTTQYLEEADRLAQRVFVIDHGRMIADDTESPRTDGPRAA
ncbi:hypothetical protein GCM10009646_81300 [Streptomyces aureus]